MAEDNKFGVSPEDQAILDRLRNNREKKESDIQPVIHYGDGLSPEQRKEKKRLADRQRRKEKEFADKKAMEQHKVVVEDEKQPLPQINTVPSDTKPQIRGKIKPEISANDNGDIILTWKRHFTSVLSIPSEIGMGGWVSLEYNTKTRELIIRGITEAI